MLSRRSLLPGAATLAAITVARTTAWADDGAFVVPMRIGENRFWTSTFINRKGPYRLFLDTGSPSYALAPSVIAELGLPSAPSRGLQGLTGGGRQTRDYTADEVVFGGVLRDRNVEFLATPFGSDFAGLFPLGLLLLRPTQVDFVDPALRIFERGRPDLSEFKPLELLRPLASVAGATPLAGGVFGREAPRLIVEVRIDGEIYRLMMDSGATTPVTLYAAAVYRRKLWDRFPNYAAGEGRGLYDSFKGRAVRMTTLQMGQVTMKNPIVHLIDPSTVDTNSDLDGLLGLEALRRLDLFIDAGANALWIRPNGLVGQAFRYNRSGMALGSVQGRLAVVRVQPGSPAETAGLAVGDLIILPDSMTAGALRHALSDEPGVVITFQAARDGKVFPVRLVLRDLI
jgi:hypothetical protein